jgi:hypothetical protein
VGLYIPAPLWDGHVAREAGEQRGAAGELEKCTALATKLKTCERIEWLGRLSVISHSRKSLEPSVISALGQIAEGRSARCGYISCEP